MSKSTKTTKPAAPRAKKTAATKKVTVKKAAAKKFAASAKKTTAKPAKKVVKKTATKKVAVKKAAPARQTPAKKTAVKKAVSKKAPAKKKSAVKKAPVTKKTTTPAKTVITAKIDIGFGNTLFLRGDGPDLSWDAGVPMNSVDADTWMVTVAGAKAAVNFKFLVNDLSWSTGEDYVAEPGSERVLTPSF
jgi:hypothetical protein